MPPAASEVLADQFASYCRGSYEVIDRGEVCWYMGRLGLTMREVLTDEASRRCLAQALHARYFVFGSLLETASFDVETHLVDPETGTRSGTGKIHVKDHDELKLRLGELARQIGAKPDDQKALAARGAASEKALAEARGLLAKDPAKAAEVARAALKGNPDSTALAGPRRGRRPPRPRGQAGGRPPGRGRPPGGRPGTGQEAARRNWRSRRPRPVKAEADATARGEAARSAAGLLHGRPVAAGPGQAGDGEGQLRPGRAAAAKPRPTSSPATRSSRNSPPPRSPPPRPTPTRPPPSRGVTTRPAPAASRRPSSPRRRRRGGQGRRRPPQGRRGPRPDAARRPARAGHRRDGEEGVRRARLPPPSLWPAAKPTPEAAKLAAERQQQLALANAKDATGRNAWRTTGRGARRPDKKHASDQEAVHRDDEEGEDALVGKKYAEAAAQYAAAAKLFNTDAAKGGTRQRPARPGSSREADEKAGKDAGRPAGRASEGEARRGQAGARRQAVRPGGRGVLPARGGEAGAGQRRGRRRPRRRRRAATPSRNSSSGRRAPPMDAPYKAAMQAMPS
ncbi:MAG: hypothetical protein U0797_21595 [Gemmataceae bacterium]